MHYVLAVCIQAPKLCMVGVVHTACRVCKYWFGGGGGGGGTIDAWDCPAAYSKQCEIKSTLGGWHKWCHFLVDSDDDFILDDDFIIYQPCIAAITC